MNKTDLISIEQIDKPVQIAELNRSQIVIGSQKHRDPLPRSYSFTEQGAARLSSVLRSSRGITVDIKTTRPIRTTT